MSKIQRALQRLQGEGRQPPVKPAGNAVEKDETSDTIATLALDGSMLPDVDDKAPGIIAKMDQRALRDAGLIAPDYHERLLADQYRDIKRPLIANAFGRRVAKVEDGNLIMVTSALAGEGKTFTSVNLAISIAQERDITALLVDADVAKPHISSVFGLSKMPGLLDIMDGGVSNPESMIVRTSMPGLSILPAGVPRQDATELLSSMRMESLVKALSERNPRRLIVFDTPPLLQTSESKVLTNLAGQVVLVVKAESTPQDAVSEALQILGDDKAIGLVLNQSRKAGRVGDFEYGYGYGFGEDEEKAGK